MTTKAMTFRLPVDFADRLRALAHDGESMAAVLIRAVVAIEGNGSNTLTEWQQTVETRLSALETQKAIQVDVDIIDALPDADDYPLGAIPDAEFALDAPAAELTLDERIIAAVNAVKAAGGKVNNVQIGKQCGCTEGKVRQAIKKMGLTTLNTGAAT